MPLMIGASLTHYRITAKLGEGGMGEVFRATDARLGRDVAIKVLPASFSRDPQSLARFEREAKALAALNHPNVAAIHGFESDQGTHFLVLELVEGDTLNQRLRRGRLPVDEALRVARQIAEAVEAAHAKGIIHRDLKPGNIKFTSDGRVKVLDFGLAKMGFAGSAGVLAGQPQAGERAGADASAPSPDASTQVQPPAETTTPGAIMGTPAYMSPEQARGQEVDKRTDVWAFGCCLFECLSGSKPFAGETVTDMMAAVLRSEPDWSQLPEETPREVVTLVRRCLEKDPRRRLRDLCDIALVLEDTTQTRATTSAPTARVESKSFGARYGVALGVAGVVLGLVIAGIGMWRQPKSAARASQIRSLAVLPFEVNTADPKLAGLDKWIPVEIVSKLGQVTNLQVVNLPAKIEQLVSQKKSEDEIARELKVDGLVRGQLHGQGEAMTVYVSVVDGATGHTVGETRKLAASVSRMSEIPNQVAVAVVEELKLQISATQRSGLQEPETKNSEAFLAVQRGRDLIYARQWEKAAVEFRAALRLDPNYLTAWAGLANSEWQPNVYGGTTNRVQEVFKRLSLEAEQWRSRCPDHPSLAFVRFCFAFIYERDWAKARKIFWDIRKHQKPDSDLLLAAFLYYCMVEGHPQVAFLLNEQARSIAPEDAIHQIDGAHMLAYFGRGREAVEAIRAIPREKVQFEDFSHVYLEAGDLAAAKENATNILARNPTAWTQCNLAIIHARLGETEQARQLLQDLEKKAVNGVHIPYGFIAGSHGALGNFDAAQRWLRKGLSEGHGDWSMVRLRSAYNLKLFGKFPWFWEIVDGMKFPPLQLDHPYFELEQAMRYKRGASGELISTTITPEPPKTLAVLPFEKIGAGTVDDDFNEGLTIDLITLLQNVNGLQVQGPMASMRFKGSTDSPKQVGEQLRVDHLLQGQVSRAGDRLRINISLQKAADGFGLWATNYDRKLSDIFAIRTDVAQQVAEALKVKLGIEQRRALSKQATGNAEAYSLYLQGRAAWNRRTIPEFERATNFFNQSLAKDTNFALAYAGLADVHVLWPAFSGDSPGPHSAAAVTFARMALEKDPLLGEPHAALGYTRFLHQSDWVGAEKEFQAAIRLSPENANAHHWYADFLFILGRYDEAFSESKRAVELDPNSVNGLYHAVVMFYSSQRERAIADVLELIAREPHFALHCIWLSWFYVGIGDLQKAAAILDRAQSLSVQTDPARLALHKALVLALQAKTKEAREILAQAEKSPRWNATRALVLHHLREDGEALDLLESVVREGQMLSDFVYVLPAWSKLHGDARFRAILKSLNLEKYVPIPSSTTGQ